MRIQRRSITNRKNKNKVQKITINLNDDMNNRIYKASLVVEMPPLELVYTILEEGLSRIEDASKLVWMDTAEIRKELNYGNGITD